MHRRARCASIFTPVPGATPTHVRPTCPVSGCSSVCLSALRAFFLLEFEKEGTPLARRLRAEQCHRRCKLTYLPPLPCRDGRQWRANQPRTHAWSGSECRNYLPLPFAWWPDLISAGYADADTHPSSFGMHAWFLLLPSPTAPFPPPRLCVPVKKEGWMALHRSLLLFSYYLHSINIFFIVRVRSYTSSFGPIRSRK
jgi:hypothetical protein